MTSRIQLDASNVLSRQMFFAEQTRDSGRFYGWHTFHHPLHHLHPQPKTNVSRKVLPCIDQVSSEALLHTAPRSTRQLAS